MSKSVIPPPESGNPNTPQCPAWCAGEHPAVAGAVHRVEVGAATVAGTRVPVVVMQVPGGDPSVVISGPVYVEVHPDDRTDMAVLLELCGRPALAGLIQRAAAILRGGEGR